MLMHPAREYRLLIFFTIDYRPLFLSLKKNPFDFWRSKNSYLLIKMSCGLSGQPLSLKAVSAIFSFHNSSTTLPLTLMINGWQLEWNAFHFRMVFMLVLCYVICWTPIWFFNVFSILQIRLPVSNGVLFVRIIHLLPCINCVLNPFIYIAYIVVEFRNHDSNAVNLAMNNVKPADDQFVEPNDKWR